MTKLTSEYIELFIETFTLELSPTQHSLCVPIINRIYQKMINDLRFDEIKVCGELIIDGHHRYIASVFANVELGRIDSHRTSSTKKYKWAEVNFVDDEWDTEDKILKLNKDDAEFNNVPLSLVIAMTK